MGRRKSTGSGKSKEISEGKLGKDGDRAKRIGIMTISLSLTRALLGQTHPEARRQELIAVVHSSASWGRGWSRDGGDRDI